MDSRIARTIMCRLPFAVIPTVHTVHYCTLKGDQRPHSLCMYYYRESKMQKLKIIQEWFIKALQFCWQVFLLVSNIPDSQAAPCQKYIRGLVLGGTCKIDSGMPTFLLFFTGVKKCKIKFGLWDALFLKSETHFGSVNDWTTSSSGLMSVASSHLGEKFTAFTTVLKRDTLVHYQSLS